MFNRLWAALIATCVCTLMGGCATVQFGAPTASPTGADATARALAWITAHQQDDGHWAAPQRGATCSDDTVTAYAMLCYQAVGARHDQEGPYQQPLAQAVKWMLANQPADGDWTRGTGPGNGMYTHGVVVSALARLYATTKDPALLEPLKKALAVTLRAQNRQYGGWRYTSKGTDSDTSVTSWQLGGLLLARQSGIVIGDEPFQLTRRWLAGVCGGRHGGLCGYVHPTPIPSMVAAGMFCHQILGLSADDPRMSEAAEYLLDHMPKKDDQANFYYEYYLTLAAYRHQGRLWSRWSPLMRERLIAGQVASGPDAGSWNPDAYYTSYGGRLFSTAMAVLMLEAARAYPR
ncbi:MAG: prenyltransferase/squalene oxidase repeat-containing protein [Planctomycetaceae bacterium]|nr:terpene cyclase/mutase family protein [Planctomycetaceae bacterium]